MKITATVGIIRNKQSKVVWFDFLFLFYLDILNELLQRENRVLHFWTLRKRRLDQCQQYVVFERSAKQVNTTPEDTLTHKPALNLI